MQQHKRLAAAFVLAVFLATLAIPPAGAASLSTWKKKLSDTANSINYVQSKLRRIKEQQKDYAQQLAASEQKLRLNRAHLKDIQIQLRNTKYRLATTRSELVTLENRLSERNELLAARMVDTYKYGNISYASILLGSADFWDLLSRAYIVKKVLQSDVDLIEGIKQDKQAVEQYKVTLETQEQERARLENRQVSVTRSVQNQTIVRGQLLSKANSERAKYEQTLAALEQESRNIAYTVRQMQKTPAGQKRLSQVWRGSFMMPVQGRITSPFGMRDHPILRSRRMHSGTDIAAPSGTTIRAGDKGYVTYAGQYGAYGNTVIIDHGGGVSSFYGHCSSFLVGAGTTVKKGQAIARVGSTGLSTGPHVHFEVLRNGVSVAPF